MIFILLLDNKKNNQIYFLIDFCIYLFISSNRFVIGADEGTTPSRVGKIVQRDYFSSRFGRILSCSKLSNLLFESLFQTIQKEISFANLYSGADEGTRTPTSLTLVPKTSASTNSATSACFICVLTLINISTLFLFLQ